jgi:hypothetical protein
MLIVDCIHNALKKINHILMSELLMFPTRSSVRSSLSSLLTYLYFVRTNKVFVPAASKTSAKDCITSDLVEEASKVCIDCSRTDRVIGAGASGSAKEVSAVEAAMMTAVIADLILR